MIRIGPQPSNPFVLAFADTGAWASLFELKSRLLADNTPNLRSRAFADLAVLVKGIVSNFERRLSPRERALLPASVVLRNRLFHQELSRVTGKLVSLGEELKRGGVWSLELSSGAVAPVKDTSTAQGRIFGWVLESAQSGAFHSARVLFARSVNVIDRLLLGGTEGAELTVYDFWARARAHFEPRT